MQLRRLFPANVHIICEIPKYANAFRPLVKQQVNNAEAGNKSGFFLKHLRVFRQGKMGERLLGGDLVTQIQQAGGILLKI
jgi:hypothetical protein